MINFHHIKKEGGVGGGGCDDKWADRGGGV